MGNSVKEFYYNNKKTYNIIAILSLCLIAWYFSIFFQKGIYFRESFYKESIEGDSYVYKSSEYNYFTVNKNDDIYTFEIKTLKDYGTIKIREADGIYYLYYPDNEVYKVEYKSGRLLNEDGTIEVNNYFADKNVLNGSFEEKYPKGFIIKTILREDIKIRGHLGGLLIAIIFLFIGILVLKYSKNMKFFGERWMFKNYDKVEFSEEYIFFYKFGYIVLSIMALVISFMVFIASVK
ncbi:hypothetical protein KQI86_05540 [Clostridium sp. MSJ-11]|uniref:Uncharacterized protein n=1 Tax=Clostridium mobile TaxID=2841512 RepID=A0ABS6EEY6_9CLOT|nr:hypothetical protein [Clostridium mobile]MBU5483786.1 hypothetical protein [Clostridium mobile]